MIPDREEDIRPRFHRSRSHHLSPSGPAPGGEEDDEDGMDDDSTLSGQILKMAGNYILISAENQTKWRAK